MVVAELSERVLLGFLPSVEVLIGVHANARSEDGLEQILSMATAARDLALTRVDERLRAGLAERRSKVGSADLGGVPEGVTF